MCDSELTEFFFAKRTEFVTELSKFSLMKQYSPNSILPGSYIPSHPSSSTRKGLLLKSGKLLVSTHSPFSKRPASYTMVAWLRRLRPWSLQEFHELMKLNSKIARLRICCGRRAKTSCDNFCDGVVVSPLGTGGRRGRFNFATGALCR